MMRQVLPAFAASPVVAHQLLGFFFCSFCEPLSDQCRQRFANGNRQNQ